MDPVMQENKDNQLIAILYCMMKDHKAQEVRFRARYSSVQVAMKEYAEGLIGKNSLSMIILPLSWVQCKFNNNLTPAIIHKLMAVFVVPWKRLGLVTFFTKQLKVRYGVEMQP